MNLRDLGDRQEALDVRSAPQGTKLVLEEQAEAGVCGSECKTIAKAALEIVGDHDTDIAEMLWKVRGPPPTVNHACVPGTASPRLDAACRQNGRRNTTEGVVCCSSPHELRRMRTTVWTVLTIEALTPISF